MPLTIADLKVLNHLLEQVFDLPEGARAAWIDTLPPPHNTFAPLLRANLLESDSAKGVETSDFLGALPTFPAASNATDPVSGERIGPYQLLRMLGEGGMSSVWLAERADGTIRREVALKLPHRDLLDRGLAARMLRERDILAALNHDNIARLYEAGIDDEGRPYLALEYVLGAPISTFCAEKNIDLNGRIRLMIQVARAVAHAHANLVVHRDLKPNNILVAAGDTAPNVKLLDFGIAKLLTQDDQSAQMPDLTQTLGRALTPDYASPEQLLEQPVTTASDIYSLGVVLYEVVTGAKPYNLKRQSASALAEAVIHADVMRPSKRRAQSKNSSEAKRIEGDLDAIILKTLKPAPAERYATASALADDLERFLARQPVMAQPDSFAYRLRRFVQRHAIAVSAGAAVSLAIIAGAGVALWQTREARLETAKTRAVKDFLQSIITVGNVDGPDAVFRRKQPIGDVLLDAAKSMPGKFADQPEIRSEIQSLLGDALGGLALRESSRAMRESQLTELTARNAPLDERMRAQVDLALSLADTDDYKRGTQLLHEAVETLAGARDKAARIALADASRELAMNKIQRYDGSSGVEDAARSVRISEEFMSGSKSHVASLSMLGYAYSFQRDLPNAEIVFDRAIALAKLLPPTDRAYEGQIRLRYAEALMVARHHQRALTQLNEAITIIEATSGADTFRWARTAVLAANLTAAMGDTPKAIAMLGKVIAVYEKFGNELDPLFISAARTFLAQSYLEYGQFTEATHYARLGYAPFKDRRDASPGAIWLAMSRYGSVLQATGDYAQSDQILNEALSAMRAANVASKNTDIPAGKRILAVTRIHKREFVEAEALLNDVITDGAGVERRYVSQRNAGRLAMALLYVEQGRLDDAEREIAAMRIIIENVAADEIAISRPAAAQLESLSGKLKLKRGDANAAVDHFQRGIDILLPRQHPQSPHLASVRADLALALATKGERTKAKALAEQARAAFATHPAVAPHLRQSLMAVDKLLKRT